MSTVHFVQHAQKDNPVAKKGEPYYWCHFKNEDEPRFFKTRPSINDITEPEFLSLANELNDQLFSLEAKTTEEVYKFICDFADEFRTLALSQQEEYNNLPESLKGSPSGTLLQERADHCEDIANQLESLGNHEGSFEELLEEVRSIQYRED